MTNAAARTRNLARVLDGLLVSGTTTRSQLASRTGLSKATIARLVIELEQAGCAETQLTDTAGRPGRRSEEVRVPRSLGHTIGLSFGLRSCHAVVLDLAGHEIATNLVETPALHTTEQAVGWVTDLVRTLEATLEGCGALLRLCVAVPGRVRRGVPITSLPAPLAMLAGVDLLSELEQAIAVPTQLVSDAEMALAGVTSQGLVAPDASAVLFTMSTVLTVATRASHGLIEARTAALGDFSQLPVVPAFLEPTADSAPAPATIGNLLSVRGLTDYAATQGLTLEGVTQLWLAGDDETAGVRGQFAAALASAVVLAAVTTDPEVCVLTGRLAQLAELVLPQVQQRIGEFLAEPPHLIVTGGDDNGLTTATGAAHTALAVEQRRLVDAVARA
jgi:predicted NBD/HSP70 family sugar kinase